MYSIIAVTNKQTAKLHHVVSLYILTYDARKLKHKKKNKVTTFYWGLQQFDCKRGGERRSVRADVSK